MKILVVNNQKGGVGKSAIACQFALYLHLKCGFKVLVIDLDHQGNTTEALSQSPHVLVAKDPSPKLFSDRVEIPCEPLLLIPADRELLTLESQPQSHETFLNNFVENLREQQLDYDYVVVDTGPNPDIRPMSALIAADAVLAPIQLNQEAIDGLSQLQADIERVRPLNPTVKLLGVLPNLVQNLPFQKENLKAVYEHFPHLFMRLADGTPARLFMRQAIAEAQAAGKAVFEIKKTQTQEVWREMQPVFDRIIVLMEGI
ncbi:ParA family protein [Methylovirgula sp. 4M-Z18]|uniref:ParA family protein n=1 Tax=Methylovirgula sp. 4M-Z18 TaxID=2293567 RepID=UPI001314000A|nr:ParA family protein [Methylovirgula sp. 4M-Z18]